MPKSRPRRRRTLLITMPPPPPPPKRWWRGFPIIATIAISVVGLASGVVTFWPRPLMDVGSQSDVHDALSATFTVRNNGIVPTRQLSLVMGLCTLVQMPEPGKGGAQVTLRAAHGEATSDPSQEGCEIGSLNIRFATSKWKYQELRMDESWEGISIRDIDLGRYSLVSGSISFAIQFQPWFIPIKREKEFRFTIKETAPGQFSWFETPLN